MCVCWPAGGWEGCVYVCVFCECTCMFVCVCAGRRVGGRVVCVYSVRVYLCVYVCVCAVRRVGG